MKTNFFAIALLSIVLTGCASLQTTKNSSISSDHSDSKVVPSSQIPHKIDAHDVSELDCAGKDMQHCAYVATVEIYSLLKNCPDEMHRKNPRYTAKNVEQDKIKFDQALKNWNIYKLKNKHIQEAFNPNNPFVKATDVKMRNILHKSSKQEMIQSCMAMSTVFINSSSLSTSVINKKSKTPLPQDWIKNFQ